MSKMIVIVECFQCKYSWKFDVRMECDLKERVIPNPYSIPKWCPLPDKPKDLNSVLIESLKEAIQTAKSGGLLPIVYQKWEETITKVEEEGKVDLIAASPILKETGYKLAILGLQSEQYLLDSEFGQAVDDHLAAQDKAEGRELEGG